MTTDAPSAPPGAAPRFFAGAGAPARFPPWLCWRAAPPLGPRNAPPIPAPPPPPLIRGPGRSPAALELTDGSADRASARRPCRGCGGPNAVQSKSSRSWSASGPPRGRAPPSWSPKAGAGDRRLPEGTTSMVQVVLEEAQPRDHRRRYPGAGRRGRRLQVSNVRSTGVSSSAARRSTARRFGRRAGPRAVGSLAGPEKWPPYTPPQPGHRRDRERRRTDSRYQDSAVCEMIKLADREAQAELQARRRSRRSRPARSELLIAPFSWRWSAVGGVIALRARPRRGVSTARPSANRLFGVRGVLFIAGDGCCSSEEPPRCRGRGCRGAGGGVHPLRSMRRWRRDGALAGSFRLVPVLVAVPAAGRGARSLMAWKRSAGLPSISAAAPRRAGAGPGARWPADGGGHEIRLDEALTRAFRRRPCAAWPRFFEDAGQV